MVMKPFKLNLPTKIPDNVPIAPQIRKLNNTASHIFIPFWANSTVNTEASPMTDPTERSKHPPIKAMVTPIPTMLVVDNPIAVVTILSALKKTGDFTEITITNTIIIDKIVSSFIDFIFDRIWLDLRIFPLLCFFCFLRNSCNDIFLSHLMTADIMNQPSFPDDDYPVANPYDFRHF